MEKATGVIVVPNWTTQPFYSVLLRMLVKGPIVIKKNKHNLVMPGLHKMKSKIAKRSDLMPCIRSNFIAAGLQESTVEIIMSSWRDSTKEKYNIYLKKWIEYCGQNSINPFNATTYDGLSFLTKMFQSGISYSSINSARSALSALLPVFDGVSFGRQHLVSKFCRGVFQLRPSLPRYAFTWDIKQLFDYYRTLGENSSLKLKALTLKLGTILALLMSQRTQTIHSLNIEYMKKEPDKITLSLFFQHC